MTAQILPRLIMWTVIVACVWYFAQQWKREAPSEQEHAAMMEAARHYQDYKAGKDRETEQARSDVPAPR